MPELRRMTPEQIRLVQESFRRVDPIRIEAAQAFYDRLFAIDPELREMFAATDMERQTAKLMATLAAVVEGLNRPETFLPSVRELARRHVDFGVEPHHYATVGEALILALAWGLGTAFTVEVCEAWRAAYAMLAREMIDAVSEEPAAA
jgi:hemoglobin-like flavoprotein